MRGTKPLPEVAGANVYNSPEPDTPSGVESAEYIADLILELKELAERSDLASLGRLLDAAYREARSRAGRGDPG